MSLLRCPNVKSNRLQLLAFLIERCFETLLQFFLANVTERSVKPIVLFINIDVIDILGIVFIVLFRYPVRVIVYF